MPTRTIRTAAVAAIAAFTLAGCGGGGLNAEQVHEELNALYPAPNPRDNTGFCAGDGSSPDGCEQLITSDGVSIYQWQDEATAVRFADGTRSDEVTVVQAGVFVLRFNPDYPTGDQVPPAYEARLRELVAGE